MKLFNLLIILLIIASCQPENDESALLKTTKSSTQKEEPGNNSKLILNEDLYNSSQSFDYRIDTAWIESEVLKLVVSYTGCEAGVDNWLISNGAYMESYPVQLGAKFMLDDPGDCDMAIVESLTFDLTPLKENYRLTYQEEKGTVVLQLETYSNSLKFEF